MAKSTKKQIDPAPNKDEILRYFRHGCSAEVISTILGIGEKELNAFLKKDDAFGRECKTARILADVDVEESLLKRAKGYDTEEEHESEIPDKDPKKGFSTKERKKVKKFVPPDPTSALAWLHNRRMERWSKNPSQTNELTDDENTQLKKIIERDVLANR